MYNLLEHSLTQVCVKFKCEHFILHLTQHFQSACVTGCHVEAGCWGWLVQLHHPSVLHRPLERQRELFKGTEENEGAFNVIWPFFVAFAFRQSPILWTQKTCEVELWTGIPTVFQGNSVAILLNAVGKRRDHNNCILHTGIQLISICRRKSCDIP